MNRRNAYRLSSPSAATRQLALAALALASVSACGNQPTQPADDLSMAAVPPDLTALPPDLLGLDLKDNGYPAGPYAQSGSVQPGDVLPDFTFMGYWSPTATTGLANANNAPFTEITFGMLHDSGAKYAILNLSAFW